MPHWPHAPLHRFERGGLFFVTAATYLKQHHYRDRQSLDRMQDRFFDLAAKHEVEVQAWCFLSNHYHLVVACLGAALRLLISQLHSLEAIECNRRDNVSGRKVWFQCRETELTFERSWLARLRYTHENAVHHRLVRLAADYPWCSAAWFERTARPAFVKTLRNVKIDRVRVEDELDVECGGLPPLS